MIRTFFSHLFESIKSLKRNGWMTVASASAVTITLVLVGIFMGVIFNATKLADDIEKNVTVSVFVDIGTKQNEMKTLEKQLKGLDNVEDISYSNKDQQLKKIQEQMGDAWNLFEGDSNPLYDVYYVRAKTPEDTKDIAKQAAKFPSVFKADYGGVNSDKIFKIAQTVRHVQPAVIAFELFINSSRRFYLESQSINDCNRNDYWITRFSYFNASFLENLNEKKLSILESFFSFSFKILVI